jgi:ribose transport system substrate-binding protein
MIKTIYSVKEEKGSIRRVNVNIAATTVEDYRKLKAAGIICVLIDSGVSNLDECDFSVMSDNIGAGYLAMKGLAEAIGGKGKIVTIQNSTSAPVRDRMAGRDKALAEYPDIKVVNSQDGKSSIDVAMEFMNNAIQADPDIVGAWALNDPNAQGFVAALKTANKLGQVKVVGIDGSSESCNLIRKGEQLGTSAQFPKTMAKQTATLLYEYIEKGKLETQHVKIPTLYVDKKNVDNFGEE